MEDRQSRLFLAVLLSLGAWMAVNYFFFPTPPPKKPDVKKETTTPEKKDSIVKVDTVSKKDGAASKEASGNNQIKTISTPAINPSEIKRNYLVASSFLVQFSSLGGRIEKFYVRNYKDLSGAEVKIIKAADEEIHGLRKADLQSLVGTTFPSVRRAYYR